MTIARKFYTQKILPFAALALLAGGASAAYAESVTMIPLEQSAYVDGVNAMCTGVGVEARQKALHNGYSLRVEVAGKNGQYLGDNMVEISGGTLAAPIAVHCAGPWVMFDVPVGTYSVTTHSGGNQPQSAQIKVRGEGQDSVVMLFPELGGEISPQQMASAH